MEEVIKRERRMDDLMNYQSLSLFPDVRLPPKFKMLFLDNLIALAILSLTRRCT